MGYYRKKPVVVQAEVWHPGLTVEGVELRPCEEPFCTNTYEIAGRAGKFHAQIKTLEGDMHVSDGDMIITGIKGERYPCRADIFAATYETVEEPA